MQAVTLEALGKRIRERRLELGMTQQELAKRAGIAQSTLSALEQGKTEKSRDLVSIAQALRTNPTFLATGVGEAGVTKQTPTSIPVLSTFMFMEDVCRQRFDDTLNQNKPLELSSSDPTAYAILIRGSGLSPYFRDKCHAVMSSREPLSHGCFALIQFQDGTSVIREIDSLDDQLVTVRRLNGAPETYEMSKIDKIDKVVLIVL